MPRLTLVVKPVGNRCPLACDYCYNSDPALRRVFESDRMAFDTLETLFRKFLEFDQERYEIIWHGGEPLLAGISFYERVLQLQESLPAELGLGARFVNRIQTNGILVTEKWADFFKKNHFRVGVSVDGPEWLHDSHRNYLNGRGSHKRVMRGVELLKRSGVKLAAGAVITGSALKDPIAVFEFMRQHFTVFDLSYCAETALPGEKPTFGLVPDEYISFILPVFDYWWELDDPNIRMISFIRYVQSVMGETPRICSRDNGCHMYLAVGANGNVYPCGKLAGLPELCFGNVTKQSFAEIMSSEKYLDYMTTAFHIPEDCRDCRWLKVCNNGCTATRYISNGIFLDKSPECKSIMAILDHVQVKYDALKEEETKHTNG